MGADQTSTMSAAMEQFQEAFDQAIVGMTLTGLDGTYLRVNDAFCQLTGFPREELVGRNAIAITHPDDVEVDLVGFENPAHYRGTPRWLEKRYIRRDGSIVWVLLKATVVTDDSGAPLFFFAQALDIGDRRRAEALAEVAFSDPLTGLANRSHAFNVLEHAIGDRRHRRRLAIAYLDLDGFKAVNDTFGHAAGDRALMEIAHRLRSTTRQGDTVARLGGDEFVVLCPSLHEETEPALLARIAEAVESPIALDDGTTITVGVSIGIARPQAGESASDLLERADRAMYESKHRKRHSHAR